MINPDTSEVVTNPSSASPPLLNQISSIPQFTSHITSLLNLHLFTWLPARHHQMGVQVEPLGNPFAVNQQAITHQYYLCFVPFGRTHLLHVHRFHWPWRVALLRFLWSPPRVVDHSSRMLRTFRKQFIRHLTLRQFARNCLVIAHFLVNVLTKTSQTLQVALLCVNDTLTKLSNTCRNPSVVLFTSSLLSVPSAKSKLRIPNLCKLAAHCT